MSRLIRRLRSRGTERGAVAVLVAIVFAGGVMLGMGALVVDVGGMYAERAQLQNGADAGALAVALGCSKGAATCNAGTSATSPAGAHANSNANDAKAAVDRVCGRDGGLGILTSCGGAQPGCAAAPVTGNYAQVQTSTLTSAGTTILPPAFGRAVAGASYQDKTVHACAQAAWGAVGSTTSLSVTVSLCSWRNATSNGTVFAQGAPYPPWPAQYPNGRTPPAAGLPGGEQVLLLHGSGNDCVGSAGSGWQLPGGFGWLDDPTGTCSTYIDVNNQYQDRTGVPVSADCVTVLDAARTNHSVVYLPIYDGVSGSGGNGTYHLAGFAAFVITGGWLNGSGGWRTKSLISNRDYCNGSQRCLYGFFTQALIPQGVLGGGASFGTTIVKMIG